MDLRNGDCLEILKDIPSKSVDLVFADLPYGQVSSGWDIKIDLDLLWKELLRIAKDDTTPFFFTCTTKFGYELISSNKKMFKYDLVWAKTNPCGFLQAKKQPMRKHELLYVFYKKQPAYDISSHKHKFIKEETKPDELKPTRPVKEGATYGNIKLTENRESVYDPPLPNSILEIKSIRLKQHSTAKPPDLMKWILKYYSKEGDVVLDPTMGSNPMGLACKEMNRKFIGIEKDEKIFKFACERVGIFN
jgi:site-specific DNA-methyltransferase (adenine-specific)